MFETSSLLRPTSLYFHSSSDDELPILAGETILIIEDDYVNYKYFEELLLETGAHLIRAITLAQAIHNLTIFPKISLIILSASMLENKDNRVLKHISDRYPYVPLIVVRSKKNGIGVEDSMKYAAITCIDLHTDSFHFIESIKELLANQLTHCDFHP